MMNYFKAAGCRSLLNKVRKTIVTSIFPTISISSLVLHGFDSVKQNAEVFLPTSPFEWDWDLVYKTQILPIL